jgi:hypothetical protein
MFLCKGNVKVPHEVCRTERVCYSRISTSLSLSRKTRRKAVRVTCYWSGRDRGRDRGRGACRNSLAVCSCCLNSCVHMLINSACLHSDLVATCVASSLLLQLLFLWFLLSCSLLSLLMSADVWFSSQPS